MPTTAKRTKPTTVAERDALRRQQINLEADEKLTKLAEEVTQREWLSVCRALDLTRAQIGAENSLTLLALAYVKEKRAHGAASWDVLLDMTDDDLAKLHGFIGDDDPLPPLAVAEGDD